MTPLKIQFLRNHTPQGLCIDVLWISKLQKNKRDIEQFYFDRHLRCKYTRKYYMQCIHDLIFILMD